MVQPFNKIQSITRKNGSSVFFVYIPREVLAQTSFHKGDYVDFTYKNRCQLLLTKPTPDKVRKLENALAKQRKVKCKRKKREPFW